MADDAQLTALATSRPRASAQLEATLEEFATLEDEIATLDEQLKEKKARAKYLGENVVVELVETEHLDHGCILSDGREFTFERTLRCGITKDNKAAAFEYLESKGADTMLRRYLTLSFGKDSKKQVALVKTMLARVLPQFEVGIKVGTAPEELVTALREILKAAALNIEIEEVTELPGATLTAFVKKELKAGRSLPEAFGVYAPLRAIPVTMTTDLTSTPLEHA
jgi:hypothetical protein